MFTHACASPIQHYCVTDLVHRADATTKAIRDLPYGLGHGLPPELSATGVVPVQDGGRDRFRPIHVRFQLDHNRIRDLLMALTRYGWEPVYEGGNVIALSGSDGAISLEPAGQQLSARTREITSAILSASRR